jgi:hypothetical protein
MGAYFSARSRGVLLRACNPRNSSGRKTASSFEEAHQGRFEKSIYRGQPEEETLRDRHPANQEDIFRREPEDTAGFTRHDPP